LRITDKALAQLRAKGDKQLITTEDARELVGLSEQQWRRLARLKFFPDPVGVGRSRCWNPGDLVTFFAKLIAIHEGMTFTQVAEFVHSTTYTLRDLADAKKFIEPIGYVHGHPRYAREEVEAWYRERLGGLDPPETPTPKRGKKKLTREHARGNGSN
jgi:hypothetical protein